MQSSSDRRSFARALLHWYLIHRRDLPWRRERDPYRIWISEVMLQQTRVAAVLDRYPDFLRRFPTTRELAKARLADVLAAWSGLGYYRRARALHRAAKIIVATHDGRLPESAEKLRSLPGIGRYTAAAISSIAFAEPMALVDGNVERVLARVYGNAQADPWSCAAALLDPKRPGDFNQALMELGATVCLPARPLCAHCPVHAFCRARGDLKRAPKGMRLKQQVNYGLLCKGNKILLVQRSEKVSLMPEMWELPQLPRLPRQPSLLKLRHSITNTDYEVNVFVPEGVAKSTRGRWVNLSSVERLPLTGLTRKILRRLSLLPLAPSLASGNQ